MSNSGLSYAAVYAAVFGVLVFAALLGFFAAGFLSSVFAGSDAERLCHRLGGKWVAGEINVCELKQDANAEVLRQWRGEC